MRSGEASARWGLLVVGLAALWGHGLVTAGWPVVTERGRLRTMAGGLGSSGWSVARGVAGVLVPRTVALRFAGLAHLPGTRAVLGGYGGWLWRRVRDAEGRPDAAPSWLASSTWCWSPCGGA